MRKTHGIKRKTAFIAAFIAAVAAGPLYPADTIWLSPEKAVELAKTQSVAVKSAQYNLKAQEYTVKSAMAGFLPVISASASAMHYYHKPQMSLEGGGMALTLPPGLDGGDTIVLMSLAGLFSGMKIETPNNLYSYAGNVAQPVFTGFRVLNGYRAAKYGLEAQQYTYGRTVTEIGLAAQQLFWGYVGALKGLEAVQETRQWFDKLLHDQQKMYDNGLIIELDILNSKIQSGNVKLTEVRMQNAIRTVADQLLLFLGLPQGSAIDADTSLLAGAAAAPASTDSVDQWIDKREDLLAMTSQIKALRALRSLHLGAYWPTIAGFFNYGRNNQMSIREEDMKLSSMVGVQLSWTLFDWGKAWRDAQKAACQTKAAQLMAENMREMVKLKYLELSRTVDESIQACDIAGEDLETAKKALAVAKLKYDAQAITNTELLTARNQLTGKMVAYTQARINMILAAEEFRVAPLGMGSSSQVQQEMKQ
ncbi:MAG: TolC family protein [Chitinispirillaceae bacterium]|nr:TolC family protein [Chitinispirillaceae bacterium]